jgi:hypothetical protein
MLLLASTPDLEFKTLNGGKSYERRVYYRASRRPSKKGVLRKIKGCFNQIDGY